MKKLILLAIAIFQLVFVAEAQNASEIKNIQKAPQNNSVPNQGDKEKSMENKQEKVYLHLSNDRRDQQNPSAEVKGEIKINDVSAQNSMDVETAKSLLKAFESKRATVLADPLEKEQAESNGWLQRNSVEIEKLKKFIAEQESKKGAEK